MNTASRRNNAVCRTRRRDRTVVFTLHLTILMGIAAFCLTGSLGPVLQAQSYLTSTGMPAFAAPEPAEMGIVDAASGNLHLEIPLGSFPQRASGALNLKLAYDSHIWNFASDGVTTSWIPLTPATEPSFGPSGGWRLTVPGILELSGLSSSGCSADLEAFTPNGTQLWFNVNFGTGSFASGCSQSSATAYAVDSSGFELFATYSKPNIGLTDIYAPDGTHVWGTGNGIPKDSNGNYMLVGQLNTSGDLFGQDTLGKL